MLLSLRMAQSWMRTCPTVLLAALIITVSPGLYEAANWQQQTYSIRYQSPTSAAAGKSI